MKKSSRKQINEQPSEQLANIKYNGTAHPVTTQWISRAQVNKFKGMADNIEEVKPEIIPGYKIRG